MIAIAIPAPVKGIEIVLPGVVGICKVALEICTAAGLKKTSVWQLFPGSRVAVHLVEKVNWLGSP